MLRSVIGIGEPAFQADDRRQERRAEAEQRHELATRHRARRRAARTSRPRAVEHQRRVAERFRAAGQNKVAVAGPDIPVGGVDRLHAGAAIDLHGERGHRFAHAEPQRGDARRVHLVGDHIDAAEDDLVESIRRKRLAQQQRAAAGNRKIDRRKRARPAARPNERRAAAIDDIDRDARLFRGRWSGHRL